MQALYQWGMTGMELSAIRAQFQADNPNDLDLDYFNELLYYIAQNVAEIDALFAPYLDRTLSDLTPIETAIFRLASYELLKRPDLPYKVVMTEAIRLTKKYGALDAYKYVNGVLEKVAKTLRSLEMTSSSHE